MSNRENACKEKLNNILSKAHHLVGHLLDKSNSRELASELDCLHLAVLMMQRHDLKEVKRIVHDYPHLAHDVTRAELDALDVDMPVVDIMHRLYARLTKLSQTPDCIVNVWLTTWLSRQNRATIESLMLVPNIASAMDAPGLSNNALLAMVKAAVREDDENNRPSELSETATRIYNTVQTLGATQGEALERAVDPTCLRLEVLSVGILLLPQEDVIDLKQEEKLSALFLQMAADSISLTPREEVIETLKGHLAAAAEYVHHEIQPNLYAFLDYVASRNYQPDLTATLATWVSSLSNLNLQRLSYNANSDLQDTSPQRALREALCEKAGYTDHTAALSAMMESLSRTIQLHDEAEFNQQVDALVDSSLLDNVRSRNVDDGDENPIHQIKEQEVPLRGRSRALRLDYISPSATNEQVDSAIRALLDVAKEHPVVAMECHEAISALLRRNGVENDSDDFEPRGRFDHPRRHGRGSSRRY